MPATGPPRTAVLLHYEYVLESKGEDVAPLQSQPLDAVFWTLVAGFLKIRKAAHSTHDALAARFFQWWGEDKDDT